jgi:hypothetical protein
MVKSTQLRKRGREGERERWKRGGVEVEEQRVDEGLTVFSPMRGIHPAHQWRRVAKVCRLLARAMLCC